MPRSVATVAEELDRAGVADHRGVFERDAVQRIEPVEAGREQAVQRRGQLARAVGRRRLAEHGDELLDEERVAAAAVAQDRDELVVGVGEQRAQERGGVVARERVEVDVHGVVPARRGSPAIGELRPGGADEHDRLRGRRG